MTHPRMRTFFASGFLVAAILLAASALTGPAPQAPVSLPTALGDQIATRSQGSNIAHAAPVSTGSSNSIYFRETGHYVKDAFLNYWLMNGGVATYGYPISEEAVYNGVTMQYFERARFEYNPNSARAWHVDLALAGSLLTQGQTFPPTEQTSPTPERAYFEQTGHSLGGAFLAFWQSNGGADIFGYPISEEMQDGNLTVQYLERARFERNGSGSVRLGRVGAELLSKDIETGLDASVAAPQPRPGFNMSFRGEASWFRADWERVLRLNKSWGNLPDDYVGRGLYAAAPADLGLYGRWARVTRGNRSVFVQFVDVIAFPDIPYVRSEGIVIDLGEEAYRALGTAAGGRYEVSFDVFWPGEEP